MNIRNINIPNIVTKGVGAAALGLVLYDSHTLGKIESSAYQKDSKANSLVKSYATTMMQEKPSIVESNLKRGIFNLRLQETVSDFFTGIIGYVKGFTSMAVSNVIPLALSVGTLATKGLLSKCFGAGLLGYGAIFVAQEGFGFGKPSSMTHDF